jgi:MFS family permease
MFMITVSASTGDFTAASGASALLAQAKEWGIESETVNHATAGITFMLGVGGLFTVWFSAYFGRLPVLFWFQIIATITVAWCAAAQSFNSYMTARILNGFFAVCAAGGGLMFINDMFFFHHRPRMINIWSTAIILSPFVGPQIMAAILQTQSWRVGMWLNFGLITFALVLTIFVGDDTFYPRHLPADRIPPRKSRVMRLIGIEQIRNKYTDNTFLGSGSRLYQTITKLPVFLTCLFYFFDCMFAS